MVEGAVEASALAELEDEADVGLGGLLAGASAVNATRIFISGGQITREELGGIMNSERGHMS